MANGYKIRLADGSEIGPMDREAVRSWYAQGLATRDTPVLPPGAKRWVTLAQAVELKDTRPGSARSDAATPGAARAGTVAAARPARRARGEQTWRRWFVAAFFAASALGAAYLALWPERWLAALDTTPWPHFALLLLVFAATLARGPERIRGIVRAAVFALGLGGFVVLGLLVAQGVRGLPLLVVASAMLAAAGCVALLAEGWLPWQRIGLGALMLLAGVGGVVWFGVVPGNALADEIIEWAASDHRFADEALGVTLELPPAWLALRPEQTILSLPPEGRLAFGNPRREAVGFLVAESAPKVASLEHYLDRFLKQRRKTHPALEEAERSDVSLAGVAGRKALCAWEEDGRRFVELAAVSRDGWTYVALAAWMPAGQALDAKRELGSLLSRLSLSGVLAGRLQDAVATATRDVPYLTATAAEMVMSQSAALALDPEVTFRRAYRLASTALTSLATTEFTELGRLTSAVYDTLPRKDRVRLAAYFDRVRADDATTPEEDREMLGLMSAAVRRLPPARLTRLRELYEKAIRLAIQRE